MTTPEAMTLAVALLVPIVGALVTMAVAWGRSSTRLGGIETTIRDLTTAVTKRLDEHSEELDGHGRALSGEATERRSKDHRHAGILQLHDHRIRTLEMHASVTPPPHDPFAMLKDEG